MLKKYKFVPINSVPIGTKFSTYRTKTSTYMMADEYTILEIREDEVICFSDRNKTETSFHKNILIEIPKTKEEWHAENFNWAKMVAAAVSPGCELYPHPWDEHEMYNAWIDTDPYNMAAKCREENLMPLGWFKIDDMHSAGIGYDYLDIGIVAEDIDRGCDIWCHASSDYFKYWPEWYPELYEEV